MKKRAVTNPAVFQCRYPGCTSSYTRAQARGRHERLSHGMRHGVVKADIHAVHPAPLVLREDPGQSVGLPANPMLDDGSGRYKVSMRGPSRPVTIKFDSTIETINPYASPDATNEQERAEDAARDITAARIQQQIDHLEARIKPLYDALAVIRALE